ncbi:MAG: LolA family protein, partial [Pyrinomonadaceae bacterium]
MQKSITNKQPIMRHKSVIFAVRRPFLLLTATALLISLVAARPMYAQEPTQTPQVNAQELLKRVSDLYIGLKNYKLEGVMVEKNDSLELKSRTESRTERPLSIAASQPGRLHMNTWFGTTPVTVISDGKSLWLYAAKEKEYIKRDDTSDLAKISLMRESPTAQIDLYKGLAKRSSEAKFLREETIT